MSNYKEEKEFTDFITLLTHILRRPAMYGVEDVEGLSLFIFGYSRGNTSLVLNEFLSDFRKFCIQDFEAKEDLAFAKLIRYRSASNSHSLELFKHVLESFLGKELEAEK